MILLTRVLLSKGSFVRSLDVMPGVAFVLTGFCFIIPVDFSAVYLAASVVDHFILDSSSVTVEAVVLGSISKYDPMFATVTSSDSLLSIYCWCF